MKKAVALLMAMMLLMFCAVGWASEEKGITFENLFIESIMAMDYHIRDVESLRGISAGDLFVEGQLWAFMDQEKDWSGMEEECYIGCLGANNYYLYSMKNGDNVMVVQYDLKKELEQCTVWIHDVPFAEAKVMFEEHFSEVYIVAAEELEKNVEGFMRLMGMTLEIVDAIQ